MQPGNILFSDGSSAPPYTVRKSKRAKRIILRMLPGKGLEVVVPWTADTACVPDVIRRFQGWIAKAQARAACAAPPAPCPRLPFSFPIRGGAEHILVQTHSGAGTERMNVTTPLPATQDASTRVLVFPAALSAALPGGESQELSAAGLTWLREWVREEARALCSAQLFSLAAEYGFRFSGVRMGFQRTRWGSCSARGNINLHAGLLFLPPPLMRYILLHELCHTRELNHSPRFWKELFRVDPEALRHDKAMRRAWKYIPAWLMAKVA